ncbi:chemotaxis protein CheX [Terasakiella sp. SH-1]|uniref:chemotaxis protein CheX n=1 Tax=Terasakiella sp. SH-1 TaxID=2560057 RepID=UPI001073CA27|nr:chemotaxis protein CheX [Terasakiella sp. SH-1]
MAEFDDLEKDIFIELLNIAVGQAAAGLSELVQEKIDMFVPNLHTLSEREASALVDEKLGHQATVISERFSGIVPGQIMLLFPQAESLILVRKMLGEEMDEASASEVEQEALSEIGNMILNSCLSSLADAFEGRFIGELPVYASGQASRLFKGKEDQEILFIEVNFRLSESDINGYIVIILSIEGMAELQQYLKNIVTQNI